MRLTTCLYSANTEMLCVFMPMHLPLARLAYCLSCCLCGSTHPFLVLLLLFVGRRRSQEEGQRQEEERGRQEEGLLEKEEGLLEGKLIAQDSLCLAVRCLLIVGFADTFV